MEDFSKIHFLSNPEPFREKGRLYLKVRRCEGRVFPDEVVRQLPFISKSDSYAKEWRWRKRSFERFLSFWKNLPNVHFSDNSNSESWADSSRMTKNILDLGCGNGWLANRLVENPAWDVWAVDVNEEELAQGARLFGRKHLRFVYADIFQGVLPEKYFDTAIVAASVQYFPDLTALIDVLKKHLKPGGEIHILDSPFYKNEKERSAAQRRTLEYYTKLGVPEMAAFYHHHLWADVEKSGGVDLNNRLEIKFLQKIKWLAPFPWVKI